MRKEFGSRTREHHVFAAIQDKSREPDGIAYAFDGNDGAGFQRSSIHENGVHLNVAVTIEVRSDACIEDWIILELDDCLFARIDGRAALAKNVPSSIETRQHSVSACLFQFGRNRPRATVDDECNV